MRMPGGKFAVALGACLALAACGKDNKEATDTATTAASARTDTGAAATTPAPAANAPMTDASIMGAIGLANAEEIADGNLADSMATNANVKAFARDMVKDHKAMQGDADKLGTQKNITPTPPPNADAEQQRAQREMATVRGSAKGAAFDKAYMDDQVSDHQATLDKLRQFETQAQDSALKGMIQKAIPKVEQHLQRAKDVQGKLGATA